MIILDELETKYLEDLLNTVYFQHQNFWCKDKILDKLRVEREEKEKMKNCKHKKERYIFKKDCCCYCGSFYKEGMGFSKTLEGI